MPACHVINDTIGDHAISCAIGGEHISKHNHVRDEIFKAAVEAGLGPVSEPGGLLPGSDDQPADVLIPIWTEGRDTVVNPASSGGKSLRGGGECSGACTQGQAAEV